jgi:hypothetical protein
VRSERFWAGGVLVALLALAGCAANTGQVSGTVKVDGEPVETGSILFVPADGKGSTAGGKIEKGQYSVKVPLGSMKVAISAPRVVGKKKLYPTADSREVTLTKESLPERYSDEKQTELKLEVVAGKNPKDWDLKTK